MAKGLSRADNPQNLPAVYRLHEVSDPRCKICKSPFRREIDAMMASGWSGEMIRRHFNAIIASQNGEEEYFNPQNISNHKRKHLTIKDAAVRKILEERAKAIGMDIEAVEDLITTTEGIAGAIAQIGLQNVMRGTAHVDAQALLQALTLIEKMKSDRGSESVTELEREFKAFLKAVKTVVSNWEGKVVTQQLMQDIVNEFQILLGQEPTQETLTIEAAETHYTEIKEDAQEG